MKALRVMDCISIPLSLLQVLLGGAGSMLVPGNVLRAPQGMRNSGKGPFMVL